MLSGCWWGVICASKREQRAAGCGGERLGGVQGEGQASQGRVGPHEACSSDGRGLPRSVSQPTTPLSAPQWEGGSRDHSTERLTEGVSEPAPRGNRSTGPWKTAEALHVVGGHTGVQAMNLVVCDQGLRAKGSPADRRGTTNSLSLGALLTCEALRLPASPVDTRSRVMKGERWGGGDRTGAEDAEGRSDGRTVLAAKTRVAALCSTEQWGEGKTGL